MTLGIDELNEHLPEGIVALEAFDPHPGRWVYRASSPHGEVVLKILATDDESDSGRARAEREVLAGYGADHACLARVYESEPMELQIGEATHVWFTQELIAGVTLEGRMGHWEPCRVIAMIECMSQAVESLWTRHHIVHRDIKPANIIERTDGDFVLIDVGFGRHQGRSAITHPQAIAGTQDYYSPEQLRPEEREKLDFRSDLYAIGINAYEAIAGQVPVKFRGDYTEYLHHLVARNYAPLENVPPVLDAIIHKLLSPEPFERYGRMPLLYRELELAKGLLECS